MNPANSPTSHSDPRSVALYANPFSGSRPNHRHIEQLLGALRDRQLEPLLLQSPAQLREALHAGLLTPDTCRALIAAGGDGTLSLVVNAVPTAPIALYPLGTENLFARHFHFDRNPAALADAIVRRRTLPVDLALADSLRFTCVASAGYDAEVVRRLALWRHDHPTQTRRITRLSYLRFILESMFQYPFPTFTLEADGVALRGALVMIFNVPRYGLGFDPCAGGSPHDGLMDFVLFGKGGVLNSAGYALATYLRRHPDLPSVTLGRASRITLIPDDDRTPPPLEIDGESTGYAPRTFTSLPGALTILDTTC